MCELLEYHYMWSMCCDRITRLMSVCMLAVSKNRTVRYPEDAAFCIDECIQ